MPCGWEGNGKSGVAPAMRYRLRLFIHVRAHGLRKRDKQPTSTRHWLGLTEIAGLDTRAKSSVHVQSVNVQSCNFSVPIGCGTLWTYLHFVVTFICKTGALLTK